MQNRRDQLQAHRFVVGRMASATLRAEPDAPQSPLRRFLVGTFIGLMLAVLAVAGFAVFGLISPGGKTSWQEPGALILEKGTGARYVFADGQLKPVLNHTSAKLILGGDLRTVSVSRKSLAGVPHGLPIGIPSAPDFLPDPGRLGGDQWRVCSALRPDETGADRPHVTLQVGADAGAGTRLGSGEALVARSPAGETYLVWNGQRLRIPDQATLAALGYGTARPYAVGPAWLNAVPAGPDLKAPAVPRRGKPGPRLDGQPTVVGQVLTAPAAGGEQFFLLQADGLEPLTATAAALVLGDPDTAQAYPGGSAAAVRARPISPAALAAAPRAARPAVDAGLPATPPAIAASPTGEVPCLDISLGAERDATVQVTLATPAADRAAGEPGARSPRDPGQVDRVLVQPGGGLLARAQPGPGVAAGTLYLLTDTGVRYPLPAEDVAGALGYGEVTPVAVPGTLLALIPAGTPLDPDAARSVLPVTPPDQIRPRPTTSTDNGP